MRILFLSTFHLHFLFYPTLLLLMFILKVKAMRIIYAKGRRCFDMKVENLIRKGWFISTWCWVCLILFDTEIKARMGSTYLIYSFFFTFFVCMRSTWFHYNDIALIFKWSKMIAKNIFNELVKKTIFRISFTLSFIEIFSHSHSNHLWEKQQVWMLSRCLFNRMK